MNELDLFFPFEPLSINKTHRSDPRTMRRYKTAEAKAYETAILREMAKNVEQIKYFVNAFNEDTHGIQVAYTWNIHHMKLLAKKRKTQTIRRISKTALDVGNPEKFTTDIIFNFLGINDALIYKCDLRKVPSMEHSSVHAKIISIPLMRIPEYQDYLTKD